jgi:crotonobetainyl-CoA:carnitine CoA-transferase CaiB-like acyl-CoA transferase
MAAGVPCASYRTVKEAMSDPHLAVRGTLATIKDGGGEYKLPNAPFQISGATTHARSRVADFNQDEDEILGGILGYTKEQIAACHLEPAHSHE